MSLVGPRPLLAEYLDRYTREELRRHDMRPGITGWAAVNGRHTLPFESRLALDVWYVDNWSLRLDLKILALTVRQVIRRSNVVTTQDLPRSNFRLAFGRRLKHREITRAHRRTQRRPDDRGLRSSPVGCWGTRAPAPTTRPGSRALSCSSSRTAPAPMTHSRAIVMSSRTVALTPMKQLGSSVTPPEITACAATKQWSLITDWCRRCCFPR